MDYLPYHIFFLLVFILIVFLITLINLFSLKGLNDFPGIDDYPKVSVLIPARNEEDSIEKCVYSLLQQDYPDFEVIAYNDNSTDNTRTILEQVKEKNEKVIIINGSEKPSDWSGKHWACHQLSQLAKGDLYLFTDADTYHKKNTLKKAVDCLIYKKIDLLTVIPRQKVKTWSEKLIIPIMIWSILSFLPIKLAEITRTRRLQITMGQYMLFRASSYKKIGGHEAIKSEILDDMPLGRLIKSSGYKWGIANGTHNIETRMYRNFNEVYNGFTRNLFCVFNYNIPLFLWVWFVLALVAVQPILIISLHFMNVEMPRTFLVQSLVTLFIAFLIWSISIFKFKYPKYLILFYPISMVLIFLIAIRSIYQTLTGKINWKGRIMER